MLEEALRALVASGPLAIVLGMAVKILWDRLSGLEATRLSDHKAAVEREDKVRDSFEGQLRKERDEYKALLLDLNTTLKGLLDTQEE